MKPWSRSATGSRLKERSRSSPTVVRVRHKRPVEDLARLLVLAAPDQVEGGVEHERDARERLHRPVVEEERDAPPLVLLGREDLLGQSSRRLSVGFDDCFTSR